MGFFSVPNTQPTSQDQAARVRAQLASNPQFIAWSKGVGNAVADPRKFGITDLPSGAWITKSGDIVTTDTGIPLAAKLLPLAPVAAGAIGGFSSPVGAYSGAAADGTLPATVPGSYASNLYASGGWGAPGATAAGLGGIGIGDVARNAANGLGKVGGKLLDSITSGNGIAGLAGLIATLATRPNGGGGSGDLMSQNPQLSELLNMSAERARRTDPLHQSITQLAMQRLPTNVQR